MRKAQDLTGQRFGRLVAVRRAEKPSPYITSTGAWWLCRCDCGKEHVTTHRHLMDGSTRSCGCLRRDRNKSRRKKNND